jgi:hypothetical protein
MFESFAPVFSNGDLAVPGYLVLLNLASPIEVQIVLERIERALLADDAPDAVAAMLRDLNWRPQLVAGVSMLLASAGDPLRDPAMIALLWDAIDGDSWVVPQLVAVAALVDPDFGAHARERVDAEAGGAKLCASLLAATSGVPALADWHAAALRAATSAGRLADAFDAADSIVTSWSATIQGALAARSPAFS